jgi:hypothetical protein
MTFDAFRDVSVGYDDLLLEAQDGDAP